MVFCVALVLFLCLSVVFVHLLAFPLLPALLEVRVFLGDVSNYVLLLNRV